MMISGVCIILACIVSNMYFPPGPADMTAFASLPGAAYVANVKGPAYEGCYLDSGVTHYLTNNRENLNIKEEFKGNDKLIIGNGKGLSITHIGNSHIIFKGSKVPYACTHITLKDILLVPFNT